MHVVVGLHQDKGDRCQCTSFMGISVPSVVGKVYSRVLMHRIREGTCVRCKE